MPAENFDPGAHGGRARRELRAGAPEELPITIDGGFGRVGLIVQLTQIVMRGRIARLDRERAQKSWQPEAAS